MIKLSTEVELPVFKNKMGYRHESMMIGSCFAENMGNYFFELNLPVLVNPFGILYNPISIAEELEILIKRKRFTEKDLFLSEGIYHSFYHHGRFSGPDLTTTLEQINAVSEKASAVLKTGHQLVITFGTSCVFRHKGTGLVVSNCHKLPASTFDHYRVSVSQITDVWIPLIEEMSRMNPDLHLIFTVSPIRHLKDGAHENQLSKSTLLMAIDVLVSRFGSDLISYFPSYELMMDELRDYRFYAADMTHLSEVAVGFIREKFALAILDDEARFILTEMDRVVHSLNHRPMNNNDTGYAVFIENQIAKVRDLQTKYPFVDLEPMMQKFYKKRVD